jgi:quinol monooxygenase YgiN
MESGMLGIVIEYDYAGDEDIWQTAVDTFMGHIDADERLSGRLSYQVNVRNDGSGRIHVGNWDSEETLKYMQSQPYFSEFAGKVKEFSGGQPRATGFKRLGKTASVVG